MEFRLLKSFILVAKLLNITQAAEQLNFTQPAVSAQIQSLENSFGVSLFERSGKNLVLTEAGQCLLPYAMEIISLYEKTFDKMARFKEFDNELKIAVSTQVINYLLLDVLLALERNFSGISVQVDRCMTIQEVLRGINEKRFDIGFIHDDCFPAQMVNYSVWEQEILWVGSKKLLNHYHNSTNIYEYPLINYIKSSVYRIRLEKKVNFEDFRSTLVYSDSDSVKRAVLDGIGISYLPRVLIEDYINDGTLEVFSDAPHLKLVISLVFLKNKRITPIINSFFDILKKHAVDGLFSLNFPSTAKSKRNL